MCCGEVLELVGTRQTEPNNGSIRNSSTAPTKILRSGLPVNNLLMFMERFLELVTINSLKAFFPKLAWKWPLDLNARYNSTFF